MLKCRRSAPHESSALSGSKRAAFDVATEFGFRASDPEQRVVAAGGVQEPVYQTTEGKKNRRLQDADTTSHTRSTPSRLEASLQAVADLIAITVEF